ncbi:MAG: hydroxymyristoyl-ACP dehydratase [Gallionella sp.]|nr:hydroxymyristoyl-ACP dehydratase [Gallionella sp.]
MLLGPAEIKKLIPHAGDMCLLSGVAQWDATHITCAANSHRNASNPLARNGKVHALTGIEFAAQAMAVHGGLTGLVGQRPRAGLLVSVRDVEARVQFLSDHEDDLQIEAEQLMAGGNSVTYSFRIQAGGQELLTGRAMVVLDATEVLA